ncbi:MAG: Hpt domain-containing protein [Pyrinomonadaceae bacterium]|nr:Hpt domain-containing protein [Pyrinomonadaceae bacterium]
MDQSQRQFLAETEDLIEQIFDDLDELREKANDRRDRRELVDRIFRRVHRVKGSAASLGLGGLSEIAHEFESLLSAVRAGRIVVDNDVLGTCESAAVALGESLQLASSGVIEPSRQALFERIRVLARVNNAKASLDFLSVLNSLPFETGQSSLTDDEKHRLEQAVAEGDDLYVVTTSFDIASFAEEFSRLKEKLAARGEVIATSPMVGAQRSNKINFQILFAGASLDVADPDLADFVGMGIMRVASKPETSASDGKAEPGSPSRQPAWGGDANSLVAGLKLTTSSSLSNFIRTDLDDLDRLISSTHDLFRATAKALDLALSPHISNEVQEELERLDVQIRRSFLSVEENLIGLRMVSIAPVLQRSARAGRAAARLSNKEIDFEVVGSNLKLDKLLSDSIADPLIQLVRNAVDHGIETAERSVRSPERKRGMVRIEVSSEGRQTCLRVTDNGRGVDPALVSQAAIKLGVIGKDTLLDMDHSLRMIFRPGFTTLSSASTISGRGVGLDVVENAVEHAGGELRVSSESGRGSTFEIRLPATFGLLLSTTVVSGGYGFCIDSAHVVNSEVIAANRIQKSENKETLLSESGILPIVRLRNLLGQPAVEMLSTDLVHIITCGFPGKGWGDTRQTECVGIIVDRVAGREEVLARNLGRHSSRWPGISGATELRDGTVALILDLPRLIQGVVTDN